MRVPFFLHQPGVAAQRIANPVSLVDLLPTLRSILGSPPSEQDVGMDLSKLYAPGDRPPPDRSLFASRTTGVAWKRAVVRDGYKLIATHPGGNELYDLTEDPNEQRDLADEMPERVAEMLRVSQAMRDEVRRWKEEPIALDVSEEDLRRLEELGYAGEGASEPSGDSAAGR
jgi:arylsulfatase A-like enzyme